MCDAIGHPVVRLRRRAHRPDHRRAHPSGGVPRSHEPRRGGRAVAQAVRRLTTVPAQKPRTSSAKSRRAPRAVVDLGVGDQRRRQLRHVSAAGAEICRPAALIPPPESRCRRRRAAGRPVPTAVDCGLPRARGLTRAMPACGRSTGPRWATSRLLTHDMNVRAGSGKLSDSLRARVEFQRRPWLVDHVEVGGVQERQDPLAQRLDLIGGHQPVGHAEQDDHHAVVVRRAGLAVRLHAGAQVSQGTRQVAVTAEREHPRRPIAHAARRRPRRALRRS